jgi:hypothetical protein
MQAEAWDTDSLDRLEQGRVAGRWHTWDVNRTSYGWGVTLYYQGDLIGECALVLGKPTLRAAVDEAVRRVPAPSVDENTEGPR